MEAETRKKKNAYLILHLCVFIWGFTAILGKLISLKAIVLVWYRMGITSLSLLVLPALYKGLKIIPKKEFLMICGIGCIVAAHWITFYDSIKKSNVSVALTSFATVSFFTALVEPFILKRKHNSYEFLLSLLVIPAMFLIFRFTSGMQAGIILGILSAFLAALFSILNKIMVSKYDPISITFIELCAGFLVIALLLPASLNIKNTVTFIPHGNDILYLFLLSVFCTSIPFILSLKSLRYMSAFTSNLTINLEPIYGILLASFIWQDYKELTFEFYCGAAIIIFAVFLNPILAKYLRPQSDSYKY